jgi:hypothetical protein
MLKKLLRKSKNVFETRASKKPQNIMGLLIVVLVIAVGSRLIFESHAAGPYTSVNADSGSLTSPATVVADSTASDGKAVQFGNTLSGSGGFITASGTNLMLGGKVWKFVGFNDYGMEGCWNGQSGTAWTIAQLDAYFTGLPANGLTRIWAPQVKGTADITTILTEAAKYNQHVVLSIGNDDGNCDPTADDPNQTGEPLSFYQGTWQTQYVGWVNTIVPMFKNSTTIAMWEIANEPGQNASVPESTMQSYLSGAAAAIKAADPNHLVESGVSYSGNMNNQSQGNETDDQNAQSSPNINVLSFHDYAYDYEGGATLSGNFTDAQTAARNLNKPFIAGEAGVEAGASCALTQDQRVTYLLTNKTTDYFNGIGPKGSASPGMAGIMFWDYEPFPSVCTYEVSPGDPLLSMVKSYVVP